MESVRYAENRMEMFQVMMEGVQPYLHARQKELLRVLGTLTARRQGTSPSIFIYETYGRTRVNLRGPNYELLKDGETLDLCGKCYAKRIEGR